MWAALGGLATGLGAYFGAREQRIAAERAANAQTRATNAALDFQRQQYGDALGQQSGLFDQARGIFDEARGYQDSALDAFTGLQGRTLDEVRGVLAPYLQAGQQAIGGLGAYGQAGLGALQGQQNLIGLGGAGAQTSAIDALRNSPEMLALTQQGEEAILQNASATGGLRGGNTQAALAQFRPQMLAQLINQQYGRLGGLSALGSQNFGALAGLGQFGAAGQTSALQDAAARQGAFSSQIAGNQAGLAGQLAGLGGQQAGNLAALSGGFGNQITDLFGQQGAIGSGRALAQGQANAGMFGGLSQIPMQMALMRALSQNRGLQGYGSGLSNDPMSALSQLKGGY